MRATGRSAAPVLDFPCVVPVASGDLTDSPARSALDVEEDELHATDAKAGAEGTAGHPGTPRSRGRLPRTRRMARVTSLTLRAPCFPRPLSAPAAAARSTPTRPPA